MTTPFRPGDSRDELIAKWELEHEDVYHFKNLYKQLYIYLTEVKWNDVDGGKYWEHLYYEKHLPQGTQEHRIWWRLQQMPASGNNYVRYLLKVDFLTLNMGTTETIYQGKKYKTWKGDVIIFCEAWLQMDYKNMWEKSKYLKSFHKFYRERIFKKYYDSYKQDLYNKAYAFNHEIKQFLKLKSPGPQIEYFRHDRGTPS